MLGCPKCKQFLRLKTNNITVLETYPAYGDNDNPIPRPGIVDAEGWEPCRLWLADLWYCPACGIEIVAGWAKKPFADVSQADFADVVERTKADVQINDYY